jgi:hypothetical protein
VITTPWNFTAPWEEMVAQQDLMTNVLMPKLAELTPNGSAYLNEADFKSSMAPTMPSLNRSRRSMIL